MAHTLLGILLGGNGRGDDLFIEWVEWERIKINAEKQKAAYYLSIPLAWKIAINPTLFYYMLSTRNKCFP